MNIVKKASVLEDDVIIVCEDDHMFTDAYDAGVLIREIKESAYLGVDLLLGGIGGFKNAVPITSNKFWIDSFWCTQFVIMYRTIFESILTYHFSEKDTADGVLSQLTSRKMVLYPFISVQRSFGYSDVTQSNNVIGNIEALFESATEKMKIYHDVFVKYYGK